MCFIFLVNRGFLTPEQLLPAYLFTVIHFSWNLINICTDLYLSAALFSYTHILYLSHRYSYICLWYLCIWYFLKIQTLGDEQFRSNTPFVSGPEQPLRALSARHTATGSWMLCALLRMCMNIPGIPPPNLDLGNWPREKWWAFLWSVASWIWQQRAAPCCHVAAR